MKYSNLFLKKVLTVDIEVFILSRYVIDDFCEPDNIYSYIILLVSVG